MNKHIRNDFVPWMDGIYGKTQLDQALKGAKVDTWDVYWSDDPKNFYGFTAYIFWKSTTGTIIFIIIAMMIQHFVVVTDRSNH